MKILALLFLSLHPKKFIMDIVVGIIVLAFTWFVVALIVNSMNNGK